MLRFVVMFGCWIAMSTGYASACAIPPDLQVGAIYARNAASLGNEIDPQQFKRLQTIWRAIRIESFTKDAALVEHVLAVRRVVLVGDPGKMRLMREHLNQIDHYLRTYCQHASPVEGRPTGTPDPMWTNAGPGPSVEQTGGESPVMDFALLGSFLGGGIVLLLGGQWLFRIVKGARTERVSCLVPAKIWIGETAVSGLITIVGRKGFRFKPESMVAQALVDEMDDGELVFLAMREGNRPAVMVRTPDGEPGFTFQNPLSAAEHTGLAARSAITPHPVMVKRQKRAPEPETG